MSVGGHAPLEVSWLVGMMMCSHKAQGRHFYQLINLKQIIKKTNAHI